MSTLSRFLAGMAVLVPAAAAQISSNFSCQPDQSCWPTALEWQSFNETVSGRLRQTVMLGSPCFADSPNADADVCATIEADSHNGTFRQEVYGSMGSTNWEQCGNASCFPGVSTTCELGRMSALYVDAQTAADVTATIRFVRQFGIRMVVRNTGHDYLGRSAASNTLALRTYKMKDMAFSATFCATDCPAVQRSNIGTIGAGVTMEEAMPFFRTHGMMVTTGVCPSVGAAGGFGQTGGHGLLAPQFGLMVDQAVEMEVVTADGMLRTVNQCVDADLFWALRGGGGGTYGVVVRYKFQLHPTTPWAVYHVEATIPNPPANVTENTVLREVMTAVASNQTRWTANAVAGVNTFAPSFVSMLEILPVATDPLGTLQELTADFQSFVAGHPGLDVSLNEYALFADQSATYAGEQAFIAKVGTGGDGTLLPSRLVTRDRFASASTIDALVDSILRGMQVARDVAGTQLAAQVSFIVGKTAPANTPDAGRETSANPAWRDTLWQLNLVAAWEAGQPEEQVDVISAAARAALEPVKAGLEVQAAYANEVDPEEADWQEVLWGANYGRLVEIKGKYDPDGMFLCWKCVGWLADDVMFSCYGRDPVPSLPVDV